MADQTDKFKDNIGLGGLDAENRKKIEEETHSKAA